MTEKKSKKRESEQDGSDVKKGIFIRLGPHAKRTLDDAAVNRTYAEVIEKLIEYLAEQDDKVKEEILSGTRVTLTRFEDLLALTQRAQHAFENKRYYFAAMTYKVINEKLTDSASSKNLRDICNYRRAHCWMKLSYELRLEALKTGNMDSYVSAQEALKQALTWLGDLRDNGDPFIDLVKHYNIACCYSLRAQYEVESRLGSDNPHFEELLEAEEKESPDKTRFIWVRIGNNWRGNKNVDDDARERVTEYATRAHSELERIYGQPAESKALLYEVMWIVETAKKDSDLLFLHSDKEVWQEKFEAWVGSMPKTSKPPLATAIDDLRQQENLARRESLARAPTRGLK